MAFNLAWAMMTESFQTIGRDFGKDMLVSSGKSELCDLCRIPEIRPLKGNWDLR